MNKLHEELETALSRIYYMEHIDLDKFYNESENTELLEVLDNAISRGYTKREEAENLQELKDNLQSFLNFETNYCYNIGDFL